jgi:pimeloyl-ACP methyl ester carboxylesterase
MTPERTAGKDLVVIVHGLWMHGAVYALLAARVRAWGYQPALFSYRSVTLSLDEIGRRLGRFVEMRRPTRVHFIGHSLGGLVVLDMLAQERALPVGRVVLLGTPASGSQAVVQLLGTRAGRALVGKALPEWRPEIAGQVAGRVEVGSIAGTLRMGIGSLVVHLSAPNDGVVAVEETRLPGIADHIVMRTSHSGMAVSPHVARQICHFLQYGRFSHA